MQVQGLDLRKIADWPGKSAAEGGIAHPAIYHMLDVAAVSECLPFHSSLNGDLVTLLVALHDLGKIGSQFRAMLQNGSPQSYKHWELSEAFLCDASPDPARPDPAYLQDMLLMRLGGTWRVWRQLVAATSGHHGGPPKASDSHWRRMRDTAGADAKVDARAFVETCLALWPQASLQGVTAQDAKAASWCLSGLTVVADWIGSNPDWFAPTAPDLSPADYLARARAQARIAVQQAGLAGVQPSDRKLFEFDLRPMQRAAQNIVLPEGPMLAVMEDETGAGKTEAALLLAQRMLLAGKARGLFVALPTMATADAMFTRAERVIGGMFTSAPSLTLAHGRSQLSKAFRQVQAHAPESDDTVCSSWLADSRRKALLGDVGVGTIDQALLSVLPTRFSTLRNYALSSKLLIVDEAHELGEPYLLHELSQLLRFHAMQGGSAIVMTATLPLRQRAALVAAFEEGAGRPCTPDDDMAYPSLSIGNGAAVRAFADVSSPKGPISVERLGDDSAALALLVKESKRGAACVWVRNAVDDAIAAVEALRAKGVDAELLHARFAMVDRKRVEASVLARFGKNGEGRAGRVLVATQVVESSLDLDFDVMVSDLAPIAALIQRAGRLWRHMDIRPADTRPVPKPTLHVLSPDPARVDDDRWLQLALSAGAYVYPLSDQWRTANVLFDVGEIVSPHGLRFLIEAVHGNSQCELPDVLMSKWFEHQGKAMAERNLASRNVIAIHDGYRAAGGRTDDAEYPTRLGVPQRILMLARMDEARLIPCACDKSAQVSIDDEMLSEVAVSASRLRKLTLPDQNAPAVVELTKHWPDWKRASVTVCIVNDDGSICEGLHYQSELGCLFISAPRELADIR